MSIKSKIKTFFFLEDDYDDNESVEELEPIKPQQKQSVKPLNVVSLQSVQKSSSINAKNSSKVILVEPRTYSEATEIADHLKNRRAVVVNLQQIDTDQGRQIVDFLSGAVYTISGEIQKIGANIFLCTPDNVEVSGNISALVKEHDLQDTRW
jgi:cell division inhibitor SepF